MLAALPERLAHWLPGLRKRREQEVHGFDDPKYFGGGAGATAAQDFGGQMHPAAADAKIVVRKSFVGELLGRRVREVPGFIDFWSVENWKVCTPWRTIPKRWPGSANRRTI
jgi:hypothetical protein